MAAPGPAGGAYPGANGKIAFTSHRTGGGDIYVMNADGTNQLQLTNDANNEAMGTWSPDGTKIVFDRVGGQLDRDIWVMDADGSDQRPLNDTATFDSGPVWSPDGTKIAFARGGDIWVMDANGSNEQNITQFVSGNTAPAWSPDGTKIAFHSQRNSNTDIYVMNADGTGPHTPLTDNAAADGVPAWSPDGTKIAFRSERDGDTEIFVMDANGTNETQLTRNTEIDDNPEWSPDGTKIAFNGFRGNNADVRVMNADGSGETALTSDPDPDAGASWQRISPLNQTAPSIPTSATEGSTITCDPGTWSGSTSFGYQWLRNGAAIAGATSSSYTLTSADVGASIACRVTATNSAGSSSADSNALVPSAAPETPPDETPPAEEPPAEAPPVPDATPPGPLTIRELNATDPPTLGKDVNVAPAKGKVFVSVPGGAARVSQSVPGLKGREFVPLEEARQIPVRSILDTRRGEVRLFTARNRKGTTLQPGAFGAGVFQVLQSRKRKARGLTVLRLKGLAARFRRCGQGKSIADEGASAARRRLSRRTIRRLRAKAKGRYRTRGRRSAATVRGTNWVMTDRCDGTLTKVTRGKVAVRDFRRKRTVVLKRGKSYLARAPGS